MEQKSNYKLAFIALLFAAIAGGGIPVLGKIGLETVPPFTFTFLRFFLASVFILPLFLKEKPKFDKYTVWIILLSLLATANVILFAFGVRLTTATISQMLYTIVPIITGIFSYLILKEKITINKIFGIIIGFFGALVTISCIRSGSAPHV